MIQTPQVRQDTLDHGFTPLEKNVESYSSRGVGSLTGFTLIELIVVMAIIGILSVIILSLLSTPRGKSNDAKIQSQFKSMSSAMEVYYATNRHYGTTDIGVGQSNHCGVTPTAPWSDTVTGLSNLGNITNYPPGTILTCYTSSQAWAASANLSEGGYFCIDSSGTGKVIPSTTNPISASPLDVTC